MVEPSSSGLPVAWSLAFSGLLGGLALGFLGGDAACLLSAWPLVAFGLLRLVGDLGLAGAPEVGVAAPGPKEPKSVPGGIGSPFFSRNPVKIVPKTSLTVPSSFWSRVEGPQLAPGAFPLQHWDLGCSSSEEESSERTSFGRVGLDCSDILSALGSENSGFKEKVFKRLGTTRG